MRRFVIALLVIATAMLAARVAAADPSPPNLTPVPVPAQPVEEKSGFVATALTLAGTALPIGIIYASATHTSYRQDVLLGISMFAFTPSAGHWYAGRFWTIGMGTRIAGMMLAGLGVLAVLDNDRRDTPPGEVLVVGGALLVGGGAVFDIITAREAADSWNREHASHIKPVAIRLGHDGYGVGLAGAF